MSSDMVPDGEKEARRRLGQAQRGFGLLGRGLSQSVPVGDQRCLFYGPRGASGTSGVLIRFPPLFQANFSGWDPPQMLREN